MHKTSAWPLALVYIALVVFASLYPFEGWRVQGVSPWVFVTAKVPPPYWTRFDVLMNIAGYAPLGFLLALGCLRSGWRRLRWVLPCVVLAGALLSLAMEFLQIYLPRRVPSNMDWLTNVGGTALGAVIAVLLEWVGLINQWARLRERWFVPEARGALVLLMLWPWALLFPAAQPFGLGQVWERWEHWLAEQLAQTPFMEWLPPPTPASEPLSPLFEVVCVALGLLVPCLLTYSVVPGWRRRLWLCASVLGVGVLATALSAALSYGPLHAWEWLGRTARVGLIVGAIWAVLTVGLSRHVCSVLLPMVLLWHLSLLNGAPTSAYFAQTLQAWEQGRFLHFYGLGQWLGWLWPYATLAYVALRMARRLPDPPTPSLPTPPRMPK